ncbi:MAG: hypothetical protein IPH39_19910 [Sulfuritalea sp.]|jgi:hypothetical protein|nr:hypothetical protein [Sulfuritalea sp.]MBK8762658.1 hypothetical protein [Sulfuritalea sp.]MBK9352274.1 hypothetical protein [Sulfuritalea sp.]
MGLLGMLGSWLAPRAAPDAALDAAMARAIETVDPLLKAVSGHERRLAPAVAAALGHCERLAAAIPGPVAIDRRGFSADSLVHALFATPDDIGEMLGRSRELREFLADPGTADCEEFHALLGMRRREKAVSGMAREGEVIRRDVPQRLLYFADHTLGEIAADQDATRERLRQAAFDSLARGFAACVAELRQTRLDASTALQIERARNGRGERRLELEARQREAIASLAPERLLDAYADWLAGADRRVYLKQNEVRVDRMGVIADGPAPDGELATLRLPELVGRDRRQWNLLVVRIRREDAREAVSRRDEANRYILI